MKGYFSLARNKHQLKKPHLTETAFEVILFAIQIMHGSCVNAMILSVTVSGIFDGQTNMIVLVAGIR